MLSRRGPSLVLVGFVTLMLYGCSTTEPLGSASPVAGESLVITQPPADYVPTAADAARAAAEEIKLLPSTAVQVDCALGGETYPIYIDPSGGLVPQHKYILADGRCFLDSVVRPVPIEALAPPH